MIEGIKIKPAKADFKLPVVTNSNMKKIRPIPAKNASESHEANIPKIPPNT